MINDVWFHHLRVYSYITKHLLPLLGKSLKKPLKKPSKCKTKKYLKKCNKKYIGVGGGAVVNSFVRGIGIVVALRPTVHEGTRRSPYRGHTPESRIGFSCKSVAPAGLKKIGWTHVVYPNFLRPGATDLHWSQVLPLYIVFIFASLEEQWIAR